MNKKANEILSAIGDLDGELIEAARPKGKASRLPLYRTLAVAACLVIAVSAVLFAFFRGGGNSSQAPSYTVKGEFLSVMQSYLSDKNSSFYSNIAAGGGTNGGGAPGDTEGGNGDYFEVTDNQVGGIIEGDLIKATDKYLFRVGSHTLYIYSLEGDKSRLISQHVLPIEEIYSTIGKYEMFLSEDGNIITLFSVCNDIAKDGQKSTLVSTIDVSDVTNPKETERIIVDGDKNTVRKIGEHFYLITTCYFMQNRIDLDNPESFIPGIDYGDTKHICAPEKIVYPDKISIVYYNYVTLLNEGSLTLEDETAVITLGDAYFSENTIIFDQSYSSEEVEGENVLNKAYTKIGLLDFSDGFIWRGYITVKGWTNNQYSYDEKDGTLRFVTSLSNTVGYRTSFFNASLYVYDIETLQRITAVEKFAPGGEGATAVRFEGDSLYVCTAEIINYRDPVYFFDLSDYENITYVDTGYIDGFSTSLIDMGEGYLLGVGHDDSFYNKLEVYKRVDDQVVSVDEFLFSGDMNTEYKSFLINREENLFGVSVSGYAQNGSTSRSGFLVVKLENEELREVGVFGNSSYYSRAFTKDGYIYLTLNDDFYAFKTNGTSVHSINTTHKFGEWTLIKEETSCTMGVLERTCVCGRKAIKDDYKSDFESHNLVEGICSKCGEDFGSEKKNADKIIYTSNGDGTCTVSGTTESIIGDVYIPTYSPKGELVVGIGPTAFMYSAVQSIDLPYSVTYIGSYAFYFCPLKSIDTKNVSEIDYCAFGSCESLEEVRFSSSLKTIGVEAFLYCDSLTNIVIPDSVTEIEDKAFAGCENLETARLPKGLTYISTALFHSCDNLNNIIIPESVTEIGYGSFFACTSLKTVIIPDSVVKIGEKAFGHCDMLVQVTLGKGVEIIESDAFRRCDYLFEIINKSSLDIQAGSEEHGMIGFYAASVTTGKSNIKMIDGYVFHLSDDKNVLLCYVGDDTELYLPEFEGGYEIGDRIFYNNPRITSVHIPDGVSAIGNEAFYGTRLTSVTLPDSVKTIGDLAFINCHLESFDMGDGVISVGKWAFRDCDKLQNLHLSANLETIGEGAFAFCEKLRNPDLPETLKEIKAEAFYGCKSITNLTIPEGITVIDRDAFRGCSSLMSILIPESVTVIKDAFYYCNMLKTIYYQGSKEQWANIALDNNNGLFNKATILYNYSK